MKDIVWYFYNTIEKVQQTQQGLNTLTPTPIMSNTGSIDVFNSDYDKDVYDALRKISDMLAKGYLQAYQDIQDPKRLSWAGSANEIREVLSHLLRTLAPDDKVTKTSWYKPEANTNGPTRRQRVKYIMKIRETSSNVEKVGDSIEVLYDKISKLVSDTYSRASEAAHISQNQQEVIRIIKYFEAFARDLLDI